MHLRTYSLAEHPQIDPVAIGIRSGILWVGEAMQIAGVGERDRLTVSRPEGATAAQTSLRNTDHWIDDEVVGPGAGPVGFGAFPFDRELLGELLLPRIVVGQMGERRWLTIDVDQQIAIFLIKCLKHVSL